MGFLSWMFEKNGLTHQKFGQVVGVLHCGVETHAKAKAHTAAWPRGENGQPQVRRGEATVYSMKNVVFCFVLLFRYSKDLSIRLMRII